MQIKIFTLPVLGCEQQNEELNRFLRGQKIIEIDRQLTVQKDTAFWTFCVTYLPVSNTSNPSVSERREKVDYKQVLDESAFALFSRLRVIRKQLADKDAVPAYAVFTDAELAEMAKIGHITPVALRSVPGIGEKKTAKYGVDLCRLLNETDGISD